METTTEFLEEVNITKLRTGTATSNGLLWNKSASVSLDPKELGYVLIFLFLS